MNVGEATNYWLRGGSNQNAGRIGELLGKVWRESVRDTMIEQLPRLRFMYPGDDPINNGFTMRIYDEWNIIYQIPFETTKTILKTLALTEGWFIEEILDGYDHIAIRIRKRRDGDTL